MKGNITPQNAIDDCWNRIGISGDATCPELEKVIRCDNCPVYLRAGRDLLERDLPSGHLNEWTDVLAKEIPVEAPGELSVIIFRLGKEWLALPTRFVKEVRETSIVQTIPHRSNDILLGLVNIQGEIQLCVSVSDLLGLEKEDVPEQDMKRRANRRLIVVEKETDRWVFPVDEVHGIYRMHPHDLQKVPVTVAKAPFPYTRGIIHLQGKSVGRLDEDSLFDALNRSLV
jgi:chemotaxis-related protein WspD